MVKRKATEQDPELHGDLSAVEKNLSTPSPVKRRRLADEKRISKINDLSLSDFKNQYIAREPLHYRTQRNGDRKDFKIDFKSAKKLSKIELDACLKLIESTSRPDYESSLWGWHPKRKKREMMEDEMRYLLVRSAGDDQDPVLGFLSFMLTHDSTPSVPVLYIYEIHLPPALRSCGLGAHLMDLAQSIAENVGVEKVMLTCFLSNKKAHGFYAKRGYVADACSPEDRRTRSKVIKPDYVIMGKVLGSSVHSAVNRRGHDDVRDGLQHGVERIATDSAPIHITERRPALKHKESANAVEKSSGNNSLVDTAPEKGWKAMFSGMFASGDVENVYNAYH
jgi:N-alpha-acetyltransferase 40